MFLTDNEFKIEDKLDEIVELMRASKNTAILMGAGMSANSGIQTFRGKDGLYSKYPSDILSRDYFYRHPDKFYVAFEELFGSIYDASPNEGHKIIAKWQNQGLVNNIYTQNIDYLSQKAINTLDISEDEKLKLITNIHEMHGTINTFTVKAGGRRTQVSLKDMLNEDNKLEYRRSVDGLNGKYLAKPDVVLFGERIHHYNHASREISRNVDLMIVLGSSLQVFPFAYLPTLMRRGKYVVIINLAKIDNKFGHSFQVEDEIVRSLKLIDEMLNKKESD